MRGPGDVTHAVLPMWPFTSGDAAEAGKAAPRKLPMESVTGEQADAYRDKYMTAKLAEFKEACEERGNPDGCNSLAEWYLVIGMDAGKARGIYDENCRRRNHGPSCLHLGFMHLTGAKGQLEVNEPEAAKLFEKACRSKQGGCERACHNAALMILAGKGAAVGAPPVPQTDPDGPKPPLTRAQLNMAIDRLKRGCDAEFAPSCYRLGTLLLTEQRCKDAVAPLQRGCDLGNPRACQNLAVLFHKGDGKGRQHVPPDAERFSDLSERTKVLLKENHMRAT